MPQSTWCTAGRRATRHVEGGVDEPGGMLDQLVALLGIHPELVEVDRMTTDAQPIDEFCVDLVHAF